MKYEELSNEIIEAVGGKQNIVSLQHCMTRLRFTLKDESQADDEKVRNIKGVLSLIKKGGQYQIVIGTYVHDVYLDICKIANIEEKEEYHKFFNFNYYRSNCSNYTYSNRYRIRKMLTDDCIYDGMG